MLVNLLGLRSFPQAVVRASLPACTVERVDMYEYINWAGTLEEPLRDAATAVFWATDWPWYERIQAEHWDGMRAP